MAPGPHHPTSAQNIWDDLCRLPREGFLPGHLLHTVKASAGSLVSSRASQWSCGHQAGHLIPTGFKYLLDLAGMLEQ